MITIKTKKEIELLREGGKILSNVLKEVSGIVAPGVTTEELENLACKRIAEDGGRPAFKGFKQSRRDKPFPTALCTSINEEIVHAPAIPARVLNDGDIISIDIGMEYPLKGKKEAEGRVRNRYSKLGGFYTDMATTVTVGKNKDKEILRLMAVTKKSLELAIRQVKPGNSIADIGRAVQQYVESEKFGVVRDLVGHGVGYEVHEDPQIPNYEIASLDNIVLKEGMVIAIEPMVTMGNYELKMASDGMTFKTQDDSLVAHYEHTIAVTEESCIVITEFE